MFALVGSERGFRLGCPQELGEGGLCWVLLLGAEGLD